MQLTKILKMLNDGKIEDLKTLLQEEIMLEDAKTTSGKTREKKLKKHLDEIGRRKTLLNSSIVVDGRQFIIDGYFACLLEEDDFICSIPFYDNVKNDFPDMSSHVIKGRENNIVFNIEYVELINKIKLAKAQKEECISFIINEKPCNFNIKNLEMFLLAMNYKKSDVINFQLKQCWREQYSSAVYATKENGSEGIVLPCLKNE